MTMRTLSSLLLLLAIPAFVLLSSCSKSEADVAGTYELDKEALKESIQQDIDNMPEEERMGAQFALSMVDNMNLTMSLNADGTATGTMSAMGGTETLSGTWTLDGNSVTLTMTNGEGEDGTLSGSVKGDTLELTAVDGEEGSPLQKLIFKKK